ncbi:ABC transporter permease [Streptococcus salivarius]|uniref:ABC transporter permease n=2 Tax=Streptococcus salivarius TaxID=1304 RepID=UPI0013DBC0D4|nr:ABC transporter permease [Streptococcus salivarius]
MLALLKRNFLLYFRNRPGVFFSLLGALISFILYIIFLQKNLTDAWAQLPNSGPLLNNWLMSGTLAVTGITTSLAALTQLVKDREHQVDKDLYLSNQGKWRLPFSYLASAIIISFAMQVLMYVLMCSYFREVPKLYILPELLLIMMLSSLLSSLVNAILVYFFQSVDSLGKFSTIVGTASGFLVGTYVPLGVLPDFAQLLMKCTPATYIAALYRQVLMKETLSETFKGQDNLLQEFQEKMGVQLKWQGLLTKENTYLIVLGGILLASILWIVLVKKTSQKK